MEEILHHLGCMKPCKWLDKLPINWCRISSINSTIGERTIKQLRWRPCLASLFIVNFSSYSPRKLRWQWKKQAFEDVSPTKNRDFPLVNKNINWVDDKIRPQNLRYELPSHVNVGRTMWSLMHQREFGLVYIDSTWFKYNHEISHGKNKHCKSWDLIQESGILHGKRHNHSPNPKPIASMGLVYLPTFTI